MNDLEEDVAAAHRMLSYPEEKVPREQIASLRNVILRQYGASPHRSVRDPGQRWWAALGPLWAHLDPERSWSCHRNEAWRDVGALPIDGPVFVWSQAGAGWRLPTARAASMLLSASAYQELVVSDVRGTWAILVNDDDFIFGVGQALVWIERLCSVR